MRYTVYLGLVSFPIPIIIPFLIYEIFNLLVSFNFFTAFSSNSYRNIFVLYNNNHIIIITMNLEAE